MIAVRPPPIADAYESANSFVLPEGLFPTAIRSGIPPPRTNSERTVCPGAFGAIIVTLISCAGIML